MSNVRAVPENHTTVVPFFNIKGAADAIEFYKRALGAEETYRQDSEGKVRICELRVGTGFIRLADAIVDPPTSSSTHLLVENADAYWKRMTDAGCEVVAPIENQFFGQRTGILRDRFGNRWLISQRIEEVSPEELQRRIAERTKK